MIEFVGSDSGTPTNDCPAIWRDPVTGDFHIRARLADPAITSRLDIDVTSSTDEIDVWLPARMEPEIRRAVEGYEPGQTGPGTPSFEYLLEHTKRSAVHLEMRDAYGEHESGEMSTFRRWLETGEDTFDWTRWTSLLAPLVKRGVTFRRLRVIAEPVSDYIRWEHHISGGNIAAGEDLRWLPRSRAYDLVLPGADLWMFDQRRIRFGLQKGDGSRGTYEFTSDPRIVRQVVASFEMAWERAIPHEEYEPS